MQEKTIRLQESGIKSGGERWSDSIHYNQLAEVHTDPFLLIRFLQMG